MYLKGFNSQDSESFRVRELKGLRIQMLKGLRFMDKKPLSCQGLRIISLMLLKRFKVQRFRRSNVGNLITVNSFMSSSHIQMIEF